MSGFPRRPSRAAYGPTFVNVRPVVNPEQEPGADWGNLVSWQGAGLSQAAQRATITGTVAGSAVTTVYQGLAWDPDSALSNITFTYVAAGRYSFEFSASYNDQNGNSQSLALVGGVVAAMNTTSLFTGIVNMTNGYSGEVRIFNSSGTLADPPAFLLQLW